VVNGLAADRVLRVGAAHSMAGTGEVHRAVAVRGTKIVAVSPDPTAWTAWSELPPG
jgi:predicted amidohydrolase YtcJ